MAERNLDFDQIIDRRHTNSLKYDFAAKRGMPEGLLPLWVADMDFKTSSYVQDALIKQAEHGIYGYSEPEDGYFEALQSWLKRHFDWEIEEKWLVRTPGIVFALAMAVKAFTKEGEAVLIQPPVYYPFQEVIRDNHRRLVENPLICTDGVYRMDYEDLEEKIVREQVKLLLLCNPHNPVGRAYSRQELSRLGEICQRHQVIVVSDEIHADFVLTGKHQPFAAISEELAQLSVTCTSPSKTFNLAGLQISNILIPDHNKKTLFRRQIASAGFSQVSAAGLTACEAAYRDGEEWYQALLSYLKENIAFTRAYLQEHLPQIKMIEPEATYLVWLDFRELGLTSRELEHLIIHQARLWLDSGAIFGKAGEGFQRINVACPRSVLKQALNQLRDAINKLQ